MSRGRPHLAAAACGCDARWGQRQWGLCPNEASEQRSSDVAYLARCVPRATFAKARTDWQGTGTASPGMQRQSQEICTKGAYLCSKQPISPQFATVLGEMRRVARKHHSQRCCSLFDQQSTIGNGSLGQSVCARKFRGNFTYRQWAQGDQRHQQGLKASLVSGKSIQNGECNAQCNR